jgi:4-amino-4-deoxy-L-arabinose transferase-like glycosyltransferase
LFRSTPSVPEARHALLVALLLAALLVLAFAVAVAAVQAIQWLPSALSAALDHRGLAAALVLIVALAAIAIFVGLRLESQGRWRLAVGLALVTVIALRLLAVVTLDSPIVSDWKAYLDTAREMLAGSGFWSARPPGYPLVLAGAFALGGVTPFVGEIVNVAASVATALAILALVRQTFDDRVALLAVFAFAIIPSAVLWTAILGVETIYGLLLVVIALAAATMVRSSLRLIVAGVALGVALGVAQYVRASSQFLLLAFLVLPLALPMPRREGLAIVVTSLLGFAVVVAPAAAWNASANDRISLSPYLYDGWIAYVGLSVAHQGQFNDEDDATVWNATGLSNDGQMPADAASRQSMPFDPQLIADQRAYNVAAGRLALERLAAVGPGIVPLAVGKAVVLWQRADQAAAWILPSSASGAARDLYSMLRELSQVGWVLVLVGGVLALVAGLRLGDVPGDRVVVIAVISVLVVATAAIHVVAQVNPRFHEYLVPALCALAAIGYADAFATIRRRRSAAAGLPA